MSFNTALSGLQAASEDLNVASNNISNASTAGFKLSRAEFADVYAASALGTSATAVGTGVRLAAVSQQFTQGTLSFTSNNLDLAVSGSGFFMLDDNGTTVYTRAGAFGVDRLGNISNSSGQILTGFLADSSGNISGARGALQVDTSNLTPVATSTTTITGNLDSSDTPPAAAWVGSPNFGDPAPAANTYNEATSTTIYDSLGNPHIMTKYFIKTATANEWDVRVQVDGVDVDSSPAAAPFTQVFDSNGAHNAGASDTISLSWAPLDSNGNANGATTPQVFSGDVTGFTQFGSSFAIQSIDQNGFTTGRLNSVEIDSSGILFGRYSNGQSLALGQITLANFSNSQGLQPLGNTNWTETFSSGSALVGAPGSGSAGLIQSGSLEDSNVDLTEQLVALITGQRNFQANAKVISTLDQVTQSIINLR